MNLPGILKYFLCMYLPVCLQHVLECNTLIDVIIFGKKKKKKDENKKKKQKKRKKRKEMK